MYIPKIGDKTPRLGITTSYTETLQGYQDGAFGAKGALCSRRRILQSMPIRAYLAASADGIMAILYILAACGINPNKQMLLISRPCEHGTAPDTCSRGIVWH